MVFVTTRAINLMGSKILYIKERTFRLLHMFFPRFFCRTFNIENNHSENPTRYTCGFFRSTLWLIIENIFCGNLIFRHKQCLIVFTGLHHFIVARFKKPMNWDWRVLDLSLILKKKRRRHTSWRCIGNLFFSSVSSLKIRFLCNTWIGIFRYIFSTWAVNV